MVFICFLYDCRMFLYVCICFCYGIPRISYDFLGFPTISCEAPEATSGSIPSESGRESRMTKVNIPRLCIFCSGASPAEIRNLTGLVSQSGSTNLTGITGIIGIIGIIGTLNDIIYNI